MEAGRPHSNSLALLVLPVFLLAFAEPFDGGSESFFSGGFTLSASDPFDVVAFVRRGEAFEEFTGEVRGGVEGCGEVRGGFRRDFAYRDFHSVKVEADCFDDVVREFVCVDVRQRTELDHSIAFVGAGIVEESVAIFDE